MSVVELKQHKSLVYDVNKEIHYRRNIMEEQIWY